MVKLLIFFMTLFFMINYFEKYLLQMFYQNFLLMGFINFLLMFPFNNLNFWTKIYYIGGMDLYSFGLILLSIWILMLMMIMSEKNMLKLNYLYYFYIMNLLMLFLILCFFMMNLMMFYLFFESSLLPIFLLIMGWGYQIDRIQAGFYMMLYTLFGSLPLLIIMYMIYLNECSLMMNFIEIKFLNKIMYLLLILAFLIKMPMYLLHLWLPKAHVEAPLVGSMILAGVMLKLGGYGLLRIMLMMMNCCMNFNKYIIVISLMGGIYSSLICLYQIDMKMLVAYSSVVHMSIFLSGLMTLMNWGYIGGFLMMIAHGLCSSGLFCLVNINYVRFKSRSLLINKGLINLYPSLSLMWFLLCSSNLSFPLSLNFFSEVLLINSLVLWEFKLIIIMMFLMFFSAMYSLYLYAFSQHGGLYSYIMYMKNIMIMEYLVLLLHWLPLNFMFLLIYLFM